VNRSSILRLALPFVGALCFMVACGPRMKPVEYEEPKNLSSGSELDDSSSSSSSSSSASSSSEGASDEGTKPASSGGSCKGKTCGQTCSECPPGDENCMEILVLKQCDMKGACVPAKVECSAGDKEAKSKDKSKDAKGK
jgi:hypothetical protein